MIKPDTARSCKSLIFPGAAALFATSAAMAQIAEGSTGIDASGDYRHEVQSCLSGNTPQDRPTCLKEARNAQADKKRGVLGNADAQFKANSIVRCEVLRGEDKAACQARVMGFGTTTGSIAGGGLLREVETVVLPPDADSIVIEPKTSDPIILLPSQVE